MTHVIAEPCIDTKDTACVDVCPVDCIHEAADGSSPMLYIDPVECIDCAACVPACPVDAIFEESDLPSQWSKYTQINADFFAGGGAAAPAAAAAGGGAAPAAAPAKKEPEPEPLPEPLELTLEEMYKDLSEMREDVATNRGREEEGKSRKRSPTLIFLAAAVILLMVYGISNNFSKSVNTSLYGKLSAFALGDRKPTLSGSVYTVKQTIGGQKYTLEVSDSIFGGRTLQPPGADRPDPEDLPQGREILRKRREPVQPLLLSVRGRQERRHGRFHPPGPGTLEQGEPLPGPVPEPDCAERRTAEILPGSGENPRQTDRRRRIRRVGRGC